MTMNAELLPWEDSTTSDPGHAMRWVAVYQDLVELAQGILDRLPVGRGSQDMRHLEAQLEHFQARLAHWRRRHRALCGLDVDEARRVVTWGARSTELTEREYQLLTLLLDGPGRGYSAREILARAWGDDTLREEQVRNYVVRLRRKLVRLGAPLSIIHAPRRGYRMHFENRVADRSELRGGEMTVPLLDGTPSSAVAELYTDGLPLLRHRSKECRTLLLPPASGSAAAPVG
jgi:DNA-binding winged helix-turn-helix (wHTH) protein